MLQALPRLIPPEFFSVGNVRVGNGIHETSNYLGLGRM